MLDKQHTLLSVVQVLCFVHSSSSPLSFHFYHSKECCQSTSSFILHHHPAFIFHQKLIWLNHFFFLFEHNFQESMMDFQVSFITLFKALAKHFKVMPKFKQEKQSSIICGFTSLTCKSHEKGLMFSVSLHVKMILMSTSDQSDFKSKFIISDIPLMAQLDLKSQISYGMCQFPWDSDFKGILCMIWMRLQSNGIGRLQPALECFELHSQD